MDDLNQYDSYGYEDLVVSPALLHIVGLVSILLGLVLLLYSYVLLRKKIDAPGVTITIICLVGFVSVEIFRNTWHFYIEAHNYIVLNVSVFAPTVSSILFFAGVCGFYRTVKFMTDRK